MLPEFGEPISVHIISKSLHSANVIVRFFIFEIEVRRTNLTISPFETTDVVGPDLANRVEITGAFADGDPTPSLSLTLGDDFVSGDVIEYILIDPNDFCPDDPAKTSPGQCGAAPDTDSDGDGVADCVDQCPNDPLKTSPGACGCGEPDTDSDNDGVPDCIEPPPPPPPSDSCPDDPNKTSPGVCGCGVPDVDTDGDGVLDCLDNCPSVPNPDQSDLDGDRVGDACDTVACCIEGECSDLTVDACIEAGGTPAIRHHVPVQPMRTGVAGEHSRLQVGCPRWRRWSLLAAAFKKLQDALGEPRRLDGRINEIWWRAALSARRAGGDRASTFALFADIEVFGGLRLRDHPRAARSRIRHILSGDLAGDDDSGALRRHRVPCRHRCRRGQAVSTIHHHRKREP